MAPRTNAKSSSTLGIPDLDSRALGFETVPYEMNLSDDISETMDGDIEPTTAQKPGNLDEILQLRNDLDEMRDEKEQAEEMTMMMARDLGRAQEDLKHKIEALESAEIGLQKREKELSLWRQGAERMPVTSFKGCKKCTKPTVASPTPSESQSQEELERLRVEVKELTASLAEKEVLIRVERVKRERELTGLVEKAVQLDKEQELRIQAEESLRIMKVGMEFRLAQVAEQQRYQNQELQKRVDVAETSLQEYANRIEVEADQGQLMQQIESLEARVQDEQKLCTFFKKNSERLSRQIKEIRESAVVPGQFVSMLKQQVTAAKPPGVEAEDKCIECDVVGPTLENEEVESGEWSSPVSKKKRKGQKVQRNR